MLNVFKEHRLYYIDIRNYPEYKIHENDSEYDILDYLITDLGVDIDLSFYNHKIYSYFGITPILLFYLPFNLITDLYLNDASVEFVLQILIFLLSLFLFKVLLIELDIKKRLYSLEILSIFLIGIGNYFLCSGSGIFVVEIKTSIFLILLAISVFYLYLKEKSVTKKSIFVFLISLSLALSVGARPHNVFLIPFFFLGVICGNRCYDKKYMLKIISVFLMPCVIYGSLLAIYNYLRFDSIFSFGWHHQLCHFNKEVLFVQWDKIFITIKNSFFCLPSTDIYTIFSLRFTDDGGLMCGIFYGAPIIVSLLITPYIYKIYRKKII